MLLRKLDPSAIFSTSSSSSHGTWESSLTTSKAISPDSMTQNLNMHSFFITNDTKHILGNHHNSMELTSSKSATFFLYKFGFTIFVVLYHFEFTIYFVQILMGPKKKTNLKSDKLAKEEPQKEVKGQPSKEAPKAKVQSKMDAQKVPTQQPPKKIQTKDAQEKEPSKVQEEALDKKAENHKVLSLEQKPLTEQEILENRRLRFNVVGTDMTSEDAEKIKQERLSKFGGPVSESKEEVQKRKQKFGIIEEESVLKKREEKFGGLDPIQNQDQGALEERKKKFGDTTPEVNLDDEIKKTKNKMIQKPGNRKPWKKGRPQGR